MKLKDTSKLLSRILSISEKQKTLIIQNKEEHFRWFPQVVEDDFSFCNTFTYVGSCSFFFLSPETKFTHWVIALT